MSKKEIDETSIRDYSIRMHAYNLALVDENNRIHWQAFLNTLARSTKEVGKKIVPVYQTYKDFYDYEKEIERIEYRESEEEIRKKKVIANAMEMVK